MTEMRDNPNITADLMTVIIRHGKVDFQWRKWSTSEQFNEDCKNKRSQLDGI